MCTIVIVALTPLNGTLRVEMYENIARSRLFSRIAERSVVYLINPIHIDNGIDSFEMPHSLRDDVEPNRSKSVHYS